MDLGRPRRRSLLHGQEGLYGQEGAEADPHLVHPFASHEESQEEITMDFTDHVVVGVDGSSTSIAAAVWARDIARAGHWPLGIVYTQLSPACACVVSPLWVLASMVIGRGQGWNGTCGVHGHVPGLADHHRRLACFARAFLSRSLS